MRSLIVFFGFFFCCYVSAAVTVYPIEVNVGKDGASKIQIMSQSNKVSFVKVIQKKIINAGTPQEKEVSVTAPDESGLIVTPIKLAITPGATRVARLLTLNPPAKESTWRVYFEEVSADDYKSEENPGNHKKTDANVGVNIVWGALVHVLPQNQTASLELDDRTVEFINTGTVRIPILEIGECSSKDNCVWKKAGATIYPDMRVRIRSFTYHPNHTYKVKYKNVVNGKTEEIPLALRAG